MGKGRQRQVANTEKESAAMSHVWRLYESGDTVSARKEARHLLESSPSEADASQARELLARTQIPKMAWAVVGVVLFFAAMLVLVALTRV
jgi:hypothetical protein